MSSNNSVGTCYYEATLGGPHPNPQASPKELDNYFRHLSVMLNNGKGIDCPPDTHIHVQLEFADHNYIRITAYTRSTKQMLKSCQYYNLTPLDSYHQQLKTELQCLIIFIWSTDSNKKKHTASLFFPVTLSSASPPPSPPHNVM